MLTEYYKAATEGAAITELDSFGVLKLTGSDRVSWLQGMITNDVEKFAAGRGFLIASLRQARSLLLKALVSHKPASFPFQ